jgi:hypothetical protein
MKPPERQAFVGQCLTPQGPIHLRAALWDNLTITVPPSFWTQKQDIGPDKRTSHGLTYDSGRKRVVLFGGDPGGPPLADTWEWDGALWTQVGDTGPSAREGLVMAFDPTAATLAKKETIDAQQQEQIETLTAGLQRVSAQIEASKPASQVVNNP